MRIKFAKKFKKQYKKAPKEIKQRFDLRLGVFVNDRENPILNEHPLVGKMTGFKSINITADWRAIFEEITEKEVVMFRSIGTHSQLYK
jgi:addiction module RelE/StbE family toxin